MTLARNPLTVAFNRKNRFLIDDPESPLKLAYALTKPLKVGSTYGGNGVFKLVLSEVNSTTEDNQELGIADYYKYLTSPDSGDNNNSESTDGERQVWL